MGSLEWFAVVLAIYFVYRTFFVPQLLYEVKAPIDLDDPASISLVANVADAALQGQNRIEVLTNGEAYYPAELEAIGQAQQTINLEFYIFSRGEIARRFVDALVAKARAGVRVNMLVDAMGSSGLAIRRDLLGELREAGCKVFFYHPLHINHIDRFNIRTHRQIIVIDGRVGFVGGAGVADHWYKAQGKQPAWRDTMVRVKGPAVQSLQGIFIENWLESSGEILTGSEYLPPHEPAGETSALVLNSSSRGRSTHARILYQVLVASARRSLCITTPYFLPDAALRRELVAARRRGVVVEVVCPGDKIDHWFTRRASRRLYGELLAEGVQIFEYAPAMIHAKVLLVDGTWAVIGTTNFDHRSFSINDEVNLVVPDGSLNERLRHDFERDLEKSREVTFEAWNSRPWFERLQEQAARIIERQQ